MTFESLNYKLLILREEKEASALATVVVFLALVRLEDLEAVVAWIEGPADFIFIHTVDMSYVFEYLRVVRVDLNVDICSFEYIILCIDRINTRQVV